jgi:hypothetical protein
LSGSTSLDWFEFIKESSFSQTITSARAGLLDYTEVKLNSTPCVTYNFLYDKYKKDKNIICSTGLMYIDIDDPSFDVTKVDANKIYSIYHSFGGLGYGIVVKIDGLTKENFNHNYKLVVKDLGLEEYIDLNAAKASQYNVLSYDPDILVNKLAKVYIAEDLDDKKEKEGCIPFGCNKKKKKKEAYTTEWDAPKNKPLGVK